MKTQFKVFYGTERNRVPVGSVTLNDNKASFLRASGHVPSQFGFWTCIGSQARRLAKSIGHAGAFAAGNENSLVTVERQS